MSDNKVLEQNKREKSMSILGRSLLTGFVGGIFWSSIGALLYYFNFTEVSPRSFVLRSWIRAEWTDTWLGNLVSILLIGILSIVVALIYYGLLKNIQSFWAGLFYGLALWVVIFYLFQPIFPNIPNLTELNQNTIVTTISLYLLYGVFIGYSISYDYRDTVVKKKKANSKKNAK